VLSLATAAVVAITAVFLGAAGGAAQASLRLERDPVAGPSGLAARAARGVRSFEVTCGGGPLTSEAPPSPATDGLPLAARSAGAMNEAPPSTSALPDEASPRAARGSDATGANAHGSATDGRVRRGPAPRSAASSKEASDGAPPQLRSFDSAAATSALTGAVGAAAERCREAQQALGAVRVSVTFAPSGRVTSALVTGGGWEGTQAGSCLAQALKAARVDPFDGALMTVHKTVSL
jgi:hypothetical protein